MNMLKDIKKRVSSSLIPVKKENTQQPPKNVGYVDQVNAHRVLGWAMTGSDSIFDKVILFVNDREVAHVDCNLPRGDLKRKGLHETGNCGFCFSKLSCMPFKQDDQIRVKIEGTHYELKNSPWVFDKSTTNSKNGLLDATEKIDRILKRIRMSPQVLLYPEKKIGVLWNAKAGCTYITRWFFFQIGDLQAALRYNKWIHEYRMHVFYKSHYYKEAQSDTTRLNYNYIKLVRNAYARAVSSYLHMVRHDYEKVSLSTFLNRPVTQKETFSFREFVDYLGSLNISRCNDHHREQIHTLETSGVITVDYLIKLEALEKELQLVENNLGLILSDKKKLKNSNHHTKRNNDRGFFGDVRFTRAYRTFPNYRYFYDDELQHRVYEIYKKDFIAYSYSKDL